MRNLLISSVIALATSSAMAAQIDLAKTELPWKNAPQVGALYKMGATSNRVHVIEAYSINCSWCNSNADSVKALALEFKDEARVQVLDLGLDSRPSDYTRWISSHNPPYPVVQDVGQKVWNELKSENAIPQTFVLNCRGELVGSTVGSWGEGEKATLRAAIQKALDVSCD